MLLGQIDWNTLFAALLKAQLAQGLTVLLGLGCAGLVAGSVLGGVGFLLMRKMGALRLASRYARAARFIAGLWLIVSFGVLLGFVGGLEGVLRGADRVLAQSQLRTDVLDRGGDLTAFGLVALDMALVNLEANESDVLTRAQEKALDEFARGKGSFRVIDFIKRLEQAEEKLVEPATQSGLNKVRAQFSIAKGGTVDSLVEPALRFFARRMLKKELESNLGGIELVQGMGRVLERMPQAAKAQGDPETLTRKELSGLIVEQAFVPALVKPVWLYVRTNQCLCLFGMLTSMLLLGGVFWLGRVIEGQLGRPSAEAAPGL